MAAMTVSKESNAMQNSRRQRASLHRLLGCSLVALLSISPPGLADEGEPPVETRSLAVVDVSADDKANAEIARDVVRAVKKRVGYEVKDTNVALNAGAEVEAQNNIRTALAFLQTGRAALEAGDAEEAYDQLASARTMIEKDFAALRDVNDYRDTLMYLALAMLRTGDEKEAKVVFERAIICRAKLHTLDLSDEEHEVFEEALESVADTPLGAITIETVPEHAEVYVNGRYRGISPATVAGLAKGEHIVTVYKAGHARHTKSVVADEEELTVVSIDMEDARRQLQYKQLTERLNAELDQLSIDNPMGGEGVKSVGALFYSELALVVHASGDGDERQVDLALFHVATKRLLKRVKGRLDWSFRNKKAVAALVNDLLEVDFVAALGGATGPSGGANSDDSVLTSWWLWTIVGAVVAGGVTAAVVATLPEDAPPPPTGGTLVVQF